ncbi:MAG: hypothetical protein HY286_05340 [Planctomycetes bacterium]|nr:hypothetical protein [Planctomycetota bacterium]
MHRRFALNKKLVRVLLIISGLTAGAITATAATWSARGHVKPFWALHFYDMSFRPEAWRRSGVDGCAGYTTRMKMMCDLLKTHRLVGMREKLVEKLLGRANEYRIHEGKFQSLYQLESGSDNKYDNYKVIEFEFNENSNGIVTAVRVMVASDDHDHWPLLWERTASTPWGDSRPASEK